MTPEQETAEGIATLERSEARQRAMECQKHARELFAGMVASALFVDYDGHGDQPILPADQVNYRSLAQLAFEAAEAFEAVRLDEWRRAT
jgi:hypothetical protein